MRMSGNITTLCAARWSSTKPTAEEDAGAEFSEVGENIYSSLRRVQIHRQEDPRANVRYIWICCETYVTPIPAHLYDDCSAMQSGRDMTMWTAQLQCLELLRNIE